MSSQIIRKAKLNEWLSRFTDQKASGLSVSAWCRQNDISKDKFFYWKRRLKDEIIAQSLPEIVPLAMPSTPQNSQPQILTASIPTGGENCTTRATFPTSTCVRVFINGITLEFDSNASEVFIHTLIKAVHHA